MESVSTEVLIIGAGAAGIRAALSAAKYGAEVLMVSLGRITESGSTFSSLSGGWGIQALVGSERTRKNLESFYDDIVQAGLGICDPKLARILVEESGPRLEDLLAYGLLLKKDSAGKPVRTRGCFSEEERAYLTEDMGNIRETFQTMLQASRAKTMTGTALKLIISDGSCRGAWIVTADRKIIRAAAHATVLAAGGGAGLFTNHLAGGSETGGGIALAYGAGAELKNLEFIQFMLGIQGNGSRGFLPLSDLKSPGMLLDSNGRDILDDCIADKKDRKRAVDERMKHHPFSSRDDSRLIDLAVAKVRGAGGKVFWRHRDSSVGQWEVVHMAHAFNGGAIIDEKAETTVLGLFAAGEAAAGPHGADRIGGCMMAATQVFGERAGRSAALRAKETSFTPDRAEHPEELDRISGWGQGSQEGETPQIQRLLIQEISDRLSVIRDEKGLFSCLKKISQGKKLLEEERGLSPFLSLRETQALSVFRLIASHALGRKESRGSHYRSDFPPVGPPMKPLHSPSPLCTLSSASQ